MRLYDFMTDLPQVGREHLGHIDVVIDDKYAFRRCRARALQGDRVLCQRLHTMQRKVNHGFRSMADALTEHLRSSTMQLGDQAHDGQTDTQTSLAAVEGSCRLAKQFEYLIEVICGNPDAAVPYA